MVPSSIRTRLDEHIIAAQALLFRTIPGGSFEIMPTWGRGYSGLSIPTFNVFLPFSPSALTDETLADSSAFFASRKAFYTVELVHDRLPEGPEFLSQRQYQPLPPQPAMYLETMTANEDLNPDVIITHVNTVPTLAAFCTMLHNVYDFPLRETYHRFPVPQLKEERIRHYLAFLDEQPVGAGTVVCTETVISVWDLCTLDAYRRQGVATKLLHHMLTDAEQHESKQAMLYSTAQAYNFFSRFGFEIFTQRQWFLPPGIIFEDDGDY